MRTLTVLFMVSVMFSWGWAEDVQTSTPTASKKARSAPVGFNSPVATIVQQPDGKILVGGNFTTYSGELAGSGFARLNADGTLDKPFTYKIAGLFYHAYFSSILVQPDGKIILGGVFQREPDTQAPTQGVARLSEDGTLDQSFSGDGVSDIKGTVESMALQPDGKIVLGGHFSSLSGHPAFGLARLESDGSFDSSFGANVGTGVGENGTVETIIIQPDEKIVISGTFYHYNGEKIDGVVRLKSDGSIDEGFLPYEKRSFFNGFTTLSPEEEADEFGPYIPSTLQELDGGLVMAGEFVAYDQDQNVFASHIIRVSPDGKVDLDFIKNISAYGFHSPVQSLTLQEDGRIIVGSDGPFSRLNADGTHDVSFLRIAGSAIQGDIQTILVDSNGKIWLGGEFAAYRGVSVGNIVRINADGTLDEDFLRIYHR